jgi:hypothetical protein
VWGRLVVLASILARLLLLLLQLLPCCRCCLLWVVAAPIQLRALTVVTLFVFFSARTRHTRVAGPSVVPRTTAFRKIQLRRLNSVAATFSRLSSGTTVVVLTRVQRHRETCIIFEFWSCSWLLSSVVVQVNQLLHVLGCPRNDDLRTWRGRRGL